ncbi:CREB-binding protein-like [Planococcus citri]|uniref:CREB-binding protein-like n=1 Tax=Planococcus citri TaxID=170843 RepID=UPI0031F95529
MEPKETPKPTSTQQPAENTSLSTEKIEKRRFKLEEIQSRFSPVLRQLYRIEESAPLREPDFKPQDLQKCFSPLLLKLYQMEESAPFLEPVDPVKLNNIPNDWGIYDQQPTDFPTIKDKLDNGLYVNPWNFVDDMRFLFNINCKYNGERSSSIYKCSSKLAKVFEHDINPIMRDLGYCCGKRYSFLSPKPLPCFGKQLCTIPRDAQYFNYLNEYAYCVKCFNEISEDTVTVADDPSQPPTVIKKDQFVEMINNHSEMEPLVECLDCGIKLHRICVLHVDAILGSEFVCDNCLKKNNKRRKENEFRAEQLPTTKLSISIEARVNRNLRKKKVETGKVTIRVVSCSEKITKVKPAMKSLFVDTGKFPQQFPFKAKAVLAFQEIDGVDVCVFGMHVQEYGSECPQPNQRRVYIELVDSVRFNEPIKFRTAVNHEILLGYLDYVKQLGYAMVHLLVRTPNEAEDFIFNCNPANRKLPIDYCKMLDTGIIEKRVIDYKNIFKQAMDDGLHSVAEFPYFENDIWTDMLEESIQELNQLEEEKRKQAEAAEASSSAENDVQKCNIDVDAEKKSNNKSVSQLEEDLSANIFAWMEKNKENFLVIRLHSSQSIANLPPIKDPDPLISCDLMDGSDAFLTMSRERGYEFSTLRRAKFSSMAMLFEIHTRIQDHFVYSCDNCEKIVKTRNDKLVPTLPQVSLKEKLIRRRILLQILGMTHSPQNKKNILEALKTDPRVITEFLKRGKEKQHGPTSPTSQLPSQQRIPEDGSNTDAGLINQDTSISQQTPPNVSLPSSNQVPHLCPDVQQLSQTLSSPSPPQQKDQILRVLNGYPHLIEVFVKQRQMQQLHLPHIQQNQQLNSSSDFQGSSQKQQQMVGDGSTNLSADTLPTEDSGPNKLPRRSQALQKLLQVLSLPTSSQQRDKISQLLNRNPHLLVEIIKGRRQMQQHQQQ